MNDDEPVTIVVAPRERFGYSAPSLESIYRNTTKLFKLIYVDGGSPPPVRDYLAAESARRGFQLIRTEHFLSPTEARNLGIDRVDTRYLVFIDNDLIAFPGWLEPLIAAAEREQAWLVGPTYLYGRPEDRIVHMTGGAAHFVERDGKRRFFESHLNLDTPYDAIAGRLRPGPTELLEFHCLLARRDLFDRIGKLDEGFLSLFEHVDLSMRVREAGGPIYYVPESVVTYIVPPPFEPMDLPYFMFRWSDAWNRASVEHMERKWSFAPDDPYLPHSLKWGTHHREIGLPALHWPLGRLAGFLKYRAAAGLGEALVQRLESSITAPHQKRRTEVLKTARVQPT